MWTGLRVARRRVRTSFLNRFQACAWGRCDDPVVVQCPYSLDPGLGLAGVVRNEYLYAVLDRGPPSAGWPGRWRNVDRVPTQGVTVWRDETVKVGRETCPSTTRHLGGADDRHPV
jgi:hypothetical protein